MNNLSLPLLVTACAAYALAHGLRAGGAVRLKTAFAGAAVILTLCLVVGAKWWPTGGTYPSAENERVVRAATEIAQRDAAKADCVVILDGSSIFTHALDIDMMRGTLEKKGMHPCVLSLALLGGEHLEREWMAGRLRSALPEVTLQKLDALPMIWLKELHWTYESHPARFVALNENTPRTLAQCEPVEAAKMLWALTNNWQDDCDAAGLKRRKALAIYPVDQATALIHQGAYNLFHVGQLQRMLGGDPGPQYSALGELSVPLGADSKKWWDDRPDADAVYAPSKKYKPRVWFERLLATAPTSWPHRDGFQLVLATMHSQNQTVQAYAATLADLGEVHGKPLLLGSIDEGLREELNDPTLWRDHTHLEREGAKIYSHWLAEQLAPLIDKKKQDMAATGGKAN